MNESYLNTIQNKFKYNKITRGGINLLLRTAAI